MILHFLFQGGNDMKVKLIAHTPEPEKVIAMAAKLCYSSSDIDALEESLTDEKIQ